MKTRLIAVATVAAFALLQLSPTRPPRLNRAEAAESPPLPDVPLRGDPVVFVVIDGVRWQEMFEGDAFGLTPHLHTVTSERGAWVGAPGRGVMSASGPCFVSLPAYREIFSGTSSLDCLDNECPRIQRPTIVDELRRHRGSAAVFSSWETIENAAAKDLAGLFLSAGRGPAESDVDPFPGSAGFRPDRLTARVALEHLESAQPDFFFLGLGEPDEYAHRGDYPRYLASIRAADRVIGELVATLDRMGPRGQRTHVFVTTDHGRAATFRHHGGAFPESARVWLAAWGPTIHARGSVITDASRRLADLAPTARTILGLPRLPTSPAAGRPLYELLGTD